MFGMSVSQNFIGLLYKNLNVGMSVSQNFVGLLYKNLNVWNECKSKFCRAII